MLQDFFGRFPIGGSRSKKARESADYRTSKSRRAASRQIEALETRAMMAAVPDGFEDTQLAAGFYLPTSMEFAPDGRLFVTEKGGDIKIVKDGNVLATPFLTLPANTYSERGVESIAFDPNFEDNGFVYVYYTHASPIFNRLSRFTVSNENPDIADPNSEVVILGSIPATGGLHNGGSMHFGNDGMLYLGVGDALVESNVQNMGSLSGKILRLDVTNYPNIIPTDNPFVNTPGAGQEIYALGFRNPFTSAIQPSTGKLFVNDVGAASWEEVDYVQAGKNYGWPNAEGMSNNPAYTNPIHTFSHNGGDAAITGAVFYEDNQFPANYFGSYFFSNLVSGEIFRMDTVNGNQVTTFATGAGSVVDFDVAADGTMYYVDVNAGTVQRIRYVGDGNRSPTVVANADVNYGPAPLTVNFSGNGTTDPDGDALTYTWNFGDGSPQVTGKNVAHNYTNNGIYKAKVMVNDGHGGLVSSPLIQVAVGEAPPQPTINAPSLTLRYAGGDEIYFEGSATDSQDGVLPDSAFSWTILFHHQTHTHPFLGPIEGVSSGTFTIPSLGEESPAVWYEVKLTVTDSVGLQTTTSVNIFPQLTDFTLATNVSGLKLTLDGATINAGTVTQGVVGITRTLGAPAFQMLASGIYLFDSWSDGGTSIHTVDVSVGNPIYTANYVQVTNDFDDFYYIQDLYQKVLKRDPTAEELKAAVQLLAGTTTKQQLADSVWNSVEHRTMQVEVMYQDYLDRAPAPGELNPLVNAMRNGMTEADAALTLVNSAEYVFRININTNDVILNYMYQDILGRPVDAAGKKEYLTKLNNGSMSRAQVAQALMYSDERWKKIIDQFYQGALGRPADTSGRNFYLAQFKSGAITERQLGATLIASDEAVRKGILARVDLHNANYINAVYQQLQGRTADNSGLAQYTTDIQTGSTRSDAVSKIWKSPEFLGKIVDSLYQNYFKRKPDAGGRAHWINQLLGGMSEVDLTITFMNSPEYANKFGASNGAYVDGLYRDILGRTADGGGRAYWVGRLNAGDSREAIARTFLSSAEKYSKIIDAYYGAFLKRGADGVGKQYYLQRLLDGTVDTWTVAQTLIASDEYFAKT